MRSSCLGLRVPIRMLALFALAVLGLGNLPAAHATAEPRPWPRLCPASNRFGVAVGGGPGNITTYDVGQLNSGWYQDFTTQASPPHPAGLGYVQTIRLSDDGPFDDKACKACPTWSQLRARVDANPRSLWLIGSEPDSPHQDNILPDHYPRLYHDLYAFLKAEDPSCQVAIGAVIQGTPVRLEYLGLVLDAYQSQYGYPMPIDVWNTHAYVCREKRPYPGCPDCWGCNMPPGVPGDSGMLYVGDDCDNMTYWTENVIALRQFMHDRGYRDRPLIITEYGILFPIELGFPMDRVQTFMLATFDWMMTTTDPDLGYPADGNRLVQAWAWMSLDWKYTEYYTFGTYLFDPDTQEISSLGSAYAAYTANLTEPALDLQLLDVRHTQPAPSPGGGETMTITADIANLGAATAENVLAHFDRDGAPAGDVTLPSLPGGEVQSASVTWTDLRLGQLLHVAVTASTADQVPECDPNNNTLTTTILVSPNRAYLPLVRRDWQP